MNWLVDLTIGLRLLVIFGLLTGILVVGFYAEENWRGPNTWTAAKAEFEARGENFDYAKLIPPTVPDEQNFGALPLFQMEPDPNDNGALKPLALKRAFENAAGSSFQFPDANRMVQGQTADLEEITSKISKRYKAILKPPHEMPEPSPLEELEALCPAMTDIRSAALARPYCRLQQDYTTMPPFNRPLGLSTEFIAVAKVFNLHATLALHDSRADLALDDMKTLFKIDAELRREPVLVSGLVADGVLAIQMQAIWEGLVTHAWNDAQLTELEISLDPIEFFSTYQLCMRGEAIGYFMPIMDQMESHFKASDLVGMTLPKDDKEKEENQRVEMVYWLAPHGWFSLSKAAGVRTFFDAANQCTDPRSRLFYPQKSDQIEKESERTNIFSPGDVLRRILVGPILDSCRSFAYSQFQVDAARIAVRAERYRLAHGTYPDSLDTLSDPSLHDIPHDIINGAPYHYSLQPSGAFQIYSVGWNMTDDGGKTVFKPDAPKSIDRKNGDWVWPALAPN